MKDQTPNLKFRYAYGLGDAIACFLHSKTVGWLTKIITKKDKPCSQCNKRRDALNVLFPIKFWRLFFKNERDLLKSLSKDYEAAGYTVEMDLDKNIISVSKTTIIEDQKVNNEKVFVNPKNDGIENYKLISSSDNKQDNLIVRVQIFKKK
jgi:hypothetical protein